MPAVLAHTPVAWIGTWIVAAVVASGLSGVLTIRKARALGVDSQLLGNTLQTLLSGVTVTQYREGTETIDVVARAVAPERLSVEGLEAINLRTATGGVVSLAQLAKLHFELEEPILWRRNKDLLMTVRAGVIDGVQGPDVAARIDKALAPVRAQLPAGYRIEVGGDSEESAKSQGSIFKMMPLMAFLMVLFLMLQLQSFSKLALVMLTAPLGLIGVSLFLLLFNQPFGFVSLLGTIDRPGGFRHKAPFPRAIPPAAKTPRGPEGVKPDTPLAVAARHVLLLVEQDARPLQRLRIPALEELRAQLVEQARLLRPDLAYRFARLLLESRLAPEHVVEAPRDLARDLHVRDLVLAHRHVLRPVDEDVRALQERVAKEPVGGQVPLLQLLLLVLEGRHPLQPAKRRDHRQEEVQFRVLRDLRLDEQRRRRRVEARAQPVDHHLPGVLLDLRGVLVAGGERVPVGDEEEALVLVLQVDPVL